MSRSSSRNAKASVEPRAGSAPRPSAPAPRKQPSLDGRQRRYLRALAHGLAPVVLVGQQGLTPPLIAATEVALEQHELIKVRLRAPEDKKAMAQALAERTCAALCGLVGHIVILYRPRPEQPSIELPERSP